MDKTLKPRVENLTKQRITLISSMLVGTVLSTIIIFSLQFFMSELVIGSEDIRAITLPIYWVNYLAGANFIISIAFVIFLNNYIRTRNDKLSQESLQVSDDKIYLNRHTGQKVFKVKDVSNYNQIKNANNTTSGFKLNLVDGEKIELYFYDTMELEKTLSELNIIKS